MRTQGAILVVDADRAVADLIVEILRDDGYAVDVAYDRGETFGSIAMQPPALILLDDHIANLSTSSLGAHITSQHQVRIPIVTTTTNPMVAKALAARDSWACLVKPFSLDALLALVTHYSPPARFLATSPAAGIV